MPVFEEPVMEDPQRSRKLRKYERVLYPLMSKPGKWGKIGEYKSESSAYQAALNLRRGKYTIPETPDAWEFVSTDVEVFARYRDQRNQFPEPSKVDQSDPAPPPPGARTALPSSVEGVSVRNHL